jgi:hypothetical protein
MTSIELRKFILDKGIENIICRVPMRPLQKLLCFTLTHSSTKPVTVDCVIDETRYKIKDGYKITVRALDESFGSEDFYLMDFARIVKDGIISLRQIKNITEGACSNVGI